LLVVDDHLTLAETLAARLDCEDGLTVVAALRSLDDLPSPTPEIDVALVGLSDVPTRADPGLAVLRAMTEVAPATRVIVMAGRTEPLVVAEAIKAGIAGWVPKDLGIDRLLDTIRGVCRDETWIPADILTGVLHVLVESNHRSTDRESLLTRLTARELAVLQCIVDGYSRNQIAEQLFLSPNTVRTHV
jgi:DNA-binding NarL/FixJ family response regulator